MALKSGLETSGNPFQLLGLYTSVPRALALQDPSLLFSASPLPSHCIPTHVKNSLALRLPSQHLNEWIFQRIQHLRTSMGENQAFSFSVPLRLRPSALLGKTFKANKREKRERCFLLPPSFVACSPWDQRGRRYANGRWLQPRRPQVLHRLSSAQEIEGPMPAAFVGAVAAAAHGNPSHSSLWGTE